MHWRRVAVVAALALAPVLVPPAALPLSAQNGSAKPVRLLHTIPVSGKIELDGILNDVR